MSFQPSGALPAGWQVSQGDWDALTALRGLAAFYVMMSHVWFQVWPAAAPPLGYGTVPPAPWLQATSWLYHGHYAVVFFIVLSGFSLAASCRASLPAGQARGFLWRRFLRIGPPYYAALLMSCAVIWLTGSEKTGSQWDISIPITGTGLLSHLLLMQDFVESTQINYALWSVAAEFHLYLCFPLFLRLCVRTPWWSVLAVYGTVYGLIGVLMALEVPDFPLAYLGLVAHFYAGIWACHQCMQRAQEGRALAGGSGGRLGIALLLGLMGISLALGFEASERYLALLDVLCTASAVLLLGHLTGRAGRSGHALGRSWWRSVGTYSYSLYLIHAPLIFLVWCVASRVLESAPAVWMALSLACPPVCLALARLFHQYFERPFVGHLQMPRHGTLGATVVR